MQRHHWKFATLFFVLLFAVPQGHGAETSLWQPRSVDIATGIWLANLNFSPDGRYFVVSTPKNGPPTTFVCDLETGKMVCKLISTSRAVFLNKECLAVRQTSWGRPKKYKDPKLPAKIRLVKWPTDFHPFGYLPDGKTALGNVYHEPDDHWDTEQIWSWNAESKEPPAKVFELETKRGTAKCYCRWHAESLKDGKTLLAPMIIAQSRTEFHKEVHLWDIKTKTMLPLELDREKQPMGLSAPYVSTTDGRLVALDWFGKGVQTWDYKTGKFLKSLPLTDYDKELKGPNLHIALSPDEKTIAISSPGNGAICLWDLESGAFLRRISDIKIAYSGNDFNFSPDGRFIVSCHEGIVQIIRVK